MIESFREHNPRRQTEAFVVHYDLTPDDIVFIERTAAKNNLPVHVIRIPAYPFVLFSTRRRRSLAARSTMSPVAYVKAAIDSLLPDHVTRALLIDADIVVTAPLDDLLDLTLSAPLAAASNIPRKHGSQFNSGVVLADIAEWRRRGVWKSAREFLFAYSDSLHSHDQHTLNLFFGADWQKLDLRYNYIEDHFRFMDRNEAYTSAEIEMARESPAIVHFAVGTDKPWRQSCRHPRASLYTDRIPSLASLRAGLAIVDPS